MVRYKVAIGKVFRFLEAVGRILCLQGPIFRAGTHQTRVGHWKLVLGRCTPTWPSPGHGDNHNFSTDILICIFEYKSLTLLCYANTSHYFFPMINYSQTSLSFNFIRMICLWPYKAVILVSSELCPALSYLCSILNDKCCIYQMLVWKLERESSRLEREYEY